MTQPDIPAEITALAQARALARRRRDWTTADRLKAQLEAAGWVVVDAGTLYSLSPAAAADLVEDGRVRHGSSRSVPSRLAEPAVGVASVVVLASERPDDLARALRALVDRAPDGTQVIVVANAPTDAQASRLQALDDVDPGAPGVITEVVWTSVRLGRAAALNAGVRRAAAPVVILLDASVEPQGDLVSAVAEALSDDTVAVAGPFGQVSADLRSFVAAAPDAVDVDAIDGAAMGFRRADYALLGPLDEHFVHPRHLDTWWSLVLRDGTAADTTPPRARRAVQVTGVPVVRHAVPDPGHDEASGGDRAARRNLYRVLKRFATRRDLLVSGTDGPNRTEAGDRP